MVMYGDCSDGPADDSRRLSRDRCEAVSAEGGMIPVATSGAGSVGSGGGRLE